MGNLTPPERLSERHDLSAFRSREPDLDDWLRRRAHRNESADASRTYVVSAEGRVIAFYSLATGAVARGDATRKAGRNMPDPIPVVILGRLAVDQGWEGRGVGRALVRDAVLRTLRAAEVVGVRAILVHAKSQGAKDFYQSRCGMTPCPVDPMTLMITLEDARRALGGEA